MKKQIGVLNKEVIKLLELNYEEEIPIFLGQSNIMHMKKEHPNAFIKYGNNIEDIISNPTYIAKNPKQNSIEYIKEYKHANKTIYAFTHSRKFPYHALYFKKVHFIYPCTSNSKQI